MYQIISVVCSPFTNFSQSTDFSQAADFSEYNAPEKKTIPKLPVEFSFGRLCTFNHDQMYVQIQTQNTVDVFSYLKSLACTVHSESLSLNWLIHLRLETELLLRKINMSGPHDPLH